MTIGSTPRRARCTGTSMHRQAGRVPSATTESTASVSAMASSANPDHKANDYRHVDEIACVGCIARLPVGPAGWIGQHAGNQQ